MIKEDSSNIEDRSGSSSAKDSINSDSCNSREINNQKK